MSRMGGRFSKLGRSTSYDGDTEGCVIQVYGNNITMPGNKTNRSYVQQGAAVVGLFGYYRRSGPLNITLEGCDGMTFLQQGGGPLADGQIVFTHPPYTPGKMILTFPIAPDGTGTDRDEPYIIEIAVTTDVAPYTPTIPPEIGDLAFVSGANATWDDNEHIDSLTFWVGKPSEGIRCVRKNMKQTSDGATFTFSASANVFISPRDDYCFVQAQSYAVPETEGYYSCTVELAGAADSPKSINIPVHIDR